jgi:hypothetical protein
MQEGTDMNPFLYLLAAPVLFAGAVLWDCVVGRWLVLRRIAITSARLARAEELMRRMKGDPVATLRHAAELAETLEAVERDAARTAAWLRRWRG